MVAQPVNVSTSNWIDEPERMAWFWVVVQNQPANRTGVMDLRNMEIINLGLMHVLTSFTLLLRLVL